MASEADALSAQPVLAACASGDPEREGATLRVASRDGSGLIMELLRSLDAEGLAPTTVFVREPSLDDVFLSPDPPMFRLSCSTRADTAVGSADGAVARPVGHGPGDDMA